MNPYRTIILLACGLWLAGNSPARAEGAALATLTQVQARLHDMGGRAISAKEWTHITEAIERLAADAESRGDGSEVVAIRLVEARAWADLRSQTQEGVRRVQSLRQHPPRGASHEAMRSLYATEAEWRSRAGESDAIRRLIAEFKGSAYFDPRSFEYRGGEGRNTPLAVRRPYAGTEESRTLLSMEKSLRKSLLAPGAAFPEFSAKDEAGQAWSSKSLEGRAYIVDFWTDSTPWRRNLPTLVEVHTRYPESQLVVIGVSMAPGADVVRRLRSEVPGASWPQVTGAEARAWAGRLGLFGESGTFLVDRNGVIRGRNLKGQELTDTVRRLVAE